MREGVHARFVADGDVLGELLDEEPGDGDAGGDRGVVFVGPGLGGEHERGEAGGGAGDAGGFVAEGEEVAGDVGEAVLRAEVQRGLGVGGQVGVAEQDVVVRVGVEDAGDERERAEFEGATEACGWVDHGLVDVGIRADCFL